MLRLLSSAFTLFIISYLFSSLHFLSVFISGVIIIDVIYHQLWKIALFLLLKKERQDEEENINLDAWHLFRLLQSIDSNVAFWETDGQWAFSTYCYFYLDEKRNSWYIGFRAIRTAFLSMCRDLKLGSKSNWLGSIFIGDWRRPLLHMAQSGFIKPQNAGPVSQKEEEEEQGKEDFISKTFYYWRCDAAHRTYRPLPTARDLFFFVTQLICT